MCLNLRYGRNDRMKTENKMDISEQVMTKRKGDSESEEIKRNIIEKGKSE